MNFSTLVIFLLCINYVAIHINIGKNPPRPEQTNSTNSGLLTRHRRSSMSGQQSNMSTTPRSSDNSKLAVAFSIIWSDLYYWLAAIVLLLSDMSINFLYFNGYVKSNPVGIVFYENDPSISMPLKHDTVSPQLNGVIAITTVVIFSLLWRRTKTKDAATGRVLVSDSGVLYQSANSLNSNNNGVILFGQIVSAAGERYVAGTSTCNKDVELSSLSDDGAGVAFGQGQQDSVTNSDFYTANSERRPLIGGNSSSTRNVHDAQYVNTNINYKATENRTRSPTSDLEGNIRGPTDAEDIQNTQNSTSEVLSRNTHRNSRCRPHSNGVVKRKLPFFDFTLPTIIRVAPYIFLAIATTHFVTDCIKVTVSRPRPCFLSYCEYDFNGSGFSSQMDSMTNGNHVQTTSKYNKSFQQATKLPWNAHQPHHRAQTGNPYLIPGDWSRCKNTHPNAHWSFPSGHTSLISSAMSWVYFDLKTGSHFFSGGFFIQVFCASVAIFVAASRYYDYKHHLTDVMFGAFLGVFFSYSWHKFAMVRLSRGYFGRRINGKVG